MKMILAIFLLAFCTMAIGAQQHMVKFPGSSSRIPSPNKEFFIINENRDLPPYHSLFLEGDKQNGRKKIMDFDRHVDVSWSQNSEIFFVNDYAESNSTDCMAIDVTSLNKISVLRLLKGEQSINHDYFKGSHLYVTCTSWKGDNKVVVLLESYDGVIKGVVNERFLVDLHTGTVSAMQ